MSEIVYQATGDGLQEVALPEYLCHKIVRAAKIIAVALSPTPGFHRLALEGAAHVDVTRAWYGNKAPQPSGYYVQYEDGYSSYSPAETFEQGYGPVDNGGTHVLRVSQTVVPIAGPIPGQGIVDALTEESGKPLHEDLPAGSMAKVIDPNFSNQYPGDYEISHVEHINGRVFYTLKTVNQMFMANQLELVPPVEVEEKITTTENPTDPASESHDGREGNISSTSEKDDTTATEAEPEQ